VSTSRAPRRVSARYLPTLFDRLRDQAPHRRVEAPQEYAITPRQMREIIQRDLGYLLNTTAMHHKDLDRSRYPAAARSALNYGVPPLAEDYLSALRWDEICAAIVEAIKAFEPRLDPDTLEVSRLTPAGMEDHHNMVVFEISGHIRMQPYPMEFMVQSMLDMDTSHFTMRTISG
jgi:type VI secretion system protein ImpF